jgi:hypothetical protein
MIKLESKTSLPSAVAVFEIKSSTDLPTVGLRVQDVGGYVGEKWQDVIPGKKRQILTFIGADGVASEIQGVVQESEAVEIGAAFKVVVEVKLTSLLTKTGGAGQKSQELVKLEVRRVVEVWADARKPAWTAKDAVSQASPAATMTADGRINRAA